MMHSSTVIHIAALLVAAWAFASAQPVQAQASPTVSELVAMAEGGSAEAEYALAQRYHEGLGVLQNYARAAELFSKAAAKGHAGAQNQLGKYHHSGLGVPQSQQEAIRLLGAAARTGDPEFLFDLAKAIENGANGSSDPAGAAAYYAQAAGAGHLEAAVSLGVLYQNGLGVEQSFERARQLYEPAAQAGHARAQNNLGLLYVRGNGVAQDYTLAAQLFATAAEQGLATAMTNLGVMYENGFGVNQDDELAASWYRRGGTVDSETGVTLTYDPRLAPPADSLEVLVAAARGGDPVAQFQLGWTLANAAMNAPERPDLFAQAAAWFEGAARRGSGYAMANLAVLHFQGRGLAQDYVTGQAWLVLARSSGVAGLENFGAGFARKLTPAQVNEAQEMAKNLWRQISR